MAKLYTRDTWVDEVLGAAERYTIKEDDGGAFKDDMQILLKTAVSQAGTALTAARMNNIEAGLDAIDTLVAAIKDLPEGFMVNGRIVPSVASNNLTLALKTLAGADPSATDPVLVVLGGALRTITGALSVTKNAGTSWGNAGSAALATKEIDWFAYLVWNTNLTPDAVDIFFSRYPGGRLFSDFSATSTNEKYAAVNATAPAATDVCVLIGRFAATLSAGAGYTWSVPTYTALNLIQRPIYETRWLNWAPTWTAAGSMTFTSVTNTAARYKIVRDRLFFLLRGDGTTGGTASTDVNATWPFSPVYTGAPVYCMVGAAMITDGGNAFGGIYANAGVLNFKKYNDSNWGLGTGRAASGNGWYEI